MAVAIMFLHPPFPQKIKCYHGTAIKKKKGKGRNVQKQKNGDSTRQHVLGH
jgi:hypothetical protein